MYNVHSARPGKCQKSYTNKIVRNQFGVKFTLSTVVKTHINSNIPIVITGPFFIQSKDMDDYKRSQDVGKQSLKFRNVAKFGENEKKEG